VKAQNGSVAVKKDGVIPFLPDRRDGFCYLRHFLKVNEEKMMLFLPSFHSLSLPLP